MGKGMVWLFRSSQGGHYDQDSGYDKKEESGQFSDEDKKICES